MPWMALQVRAGREVKLPFAIMTSGDTHDRTLELLQKNAYFGLNPTQVTLMRQNKVASLLDNDGHFAAGEDWSILTKPHGHGDVHYLMHSLGVAKRWRDEYKTEFAVFFQDTNALVFHAVLPALGVSAAESYAVNSIAGPRQAKREMGAIIKLTRPDGTAITNNVEYNQLDALLRGSGRYVSRATHLFLS
jgi:UDP-sugar pyrophosphorylase